MLSGLCKPIRVNIFHMYSLKRATATERLQTKIEMERTAKHTGTKSPNQPEEILKKVKSKVKV